MFHNIINNTIRNKEEIILQQKCHDTPSIERSVTADPSKPSPKMHLSLHMTCAVDGTASVLCDINKDRAVRKNANSSLPSTITHSQSRGMEEGRVHATLLVCQHVLCVVCGEERKAKFLELGFLILCKPHLNCYTWSKHARQPLEISKRNTLVAAAMEGDRDVQYCTEELWIGQWPQVPIIRKLILKKNHEWR